LALDYLSLPARDRPAGDRLAVARRDGTGDTVDQRRSHDEPHLGEGDRLAGDGLCSPQLVVAAHRTEVDPPDDVRVEHLEQRLEVAISRSRDEGVDDSTLRVEVGVRDRVLALDAPPRAARGRAT